MPQMKHLGVLGGTFDPPHVGHLLLAEAALTQLQLDKVLFVPTGFSEEKVLAGRNVSDVSTRVWMTKQTIRGRNEFRYSDVDVKRPGKTMTVDTLSDLHKRHKKSTLYFICGSEVFNTMHEWEGATEIPDLANLIVGFDGSHPADFSSYRSVFPDITGRACVIDIPPAPAHSTQIREMVARCLSIKYLVDEKVRRYIYRKDLYREKDTR